MNFGFIEIINSIEAEISYQYLPGAIRWADETHNNAWSNAIDRFDRALSTAHEGLNYSSVKMEAVLYKKTVLDLIAKYKKEKKMTNIESYLDSLASQTELSLTGEVA